MKQCLSWRLWTAPWARLPRCPPCRPCLGLMCLGPCPPTAVRLTYPQHALSPRQTTTTPANLNSRKVALSKLEVHSGTQTLDPHFTNIKPCIRTCTWAFFSWSICREGVVSHSAALCSTRSLSQNSSVLPEEEDEKSCSESEVQARASRRKLAVEQQEVCVCVCSMCVCTVCVCTVCVCVSHSSSVF